MLDVIGLVAAIFVAGFASGYFARAMVSRHRRRQHRPIQRAASGWRSIPSPPLVVTDEGAGGNSPQAVQSAAPVEVIGPRDTAPR
jgi:hypothetical protein